MQLNNDHNKQQLNSNNTLSCSKMSAWCLNTYAAAAKSRQSYPTLCGPIDGSPPGSLVPGILQARTLEWVAISFSNAWKWKVKVKSLSRDRPLATPWTAAYQAPPSMGFSRQEYWSGLPLPSPNNVCNNMFFFIRYYKMLSIVPHFDFLSLICENRFYSKSNAEWKKAGDECDNHAYVCQHSDAYINDLVKLSNTLQ